MMIIGILPTLTRSCSTARRSSSNPRYALLNEQIFAARGEDLHIAINGVERLAVYADTVAPEAACTSVQLHQMVDPGAFGAHWNAAQSVAGIQLALAANSPFFLSASCGGRPGSRCSSRPRTRARRSSRRRACGRACGSASAGSPRSSTCSRRTSATSRRCCRWSRTRTRWRCSSRGGAPHLQELRLHNGTIYRWNRPIYQVVGDRPHLRVENRVLPAGPTIVDTLANAAFYYGLVKVLVEDERPIWSQMSFSAAEENFHACARDGIDARVYWPGVGEVPAAELILRRLLPMAGDGLTAGRRHRRPDRLLGIVERRCVQLTNGAAWQAATVPPALRQPRPRRCAASMTLRIGSTCTPTSRSTPGRCPRRYGAAFPPR